VYSRMSGLVHCFSHDLSTDLTQPLALHDALPISIPPNLYNNVFSLNAITQDNITISSYNLSGQNLTLNLPQALPAGSATTLVMNFSLNIPQKKSDDVFGYDFNQINLVDWYPFIVPYHNGWVL